MGLANNTRNAVIPTQTWYGSIIMRFVGTKTGKIFLKYSGVLVVLLVLLVLYVK